MHTRNGGSASMYSDADAIMEPVYDSEPESIASHSGSLSPQPQLQRHLSNPTQHQDHHKGHHSERHPQQHLQHHQHQNNHSQSHIPRTSKETSPSQTHPWVARISDALTVALAQPMSGRTDETTKAIQTMCQASLKAILQSTSLALRDLQYVEEVPAAEDHKSHLRDALTRLEHTGISVISQVIKSSESSSKNLSSFPKRQPGSGAEGESGQMVPVQEMTDFVDGMAKEWARKAESLATADSWSRPARVAPPASDHLMTEISSSTEHSISVELPLPRDPSLKRSSVSSTQSYSRSSRREEETPRLAPEGIKEERDKEKENLVITMPETRPRASPESKRSDQRARQNGETQARASGLSIRGGEIRSRAPESERGKGETGHIQRETREEETRAGKSQMERWGEVQERRLSVEGNKRVAERAAEALPAHVADPPMHPDRKRLLDLGSGSAAPAQPQFSPAPSRESRQRSRERAPARREPLSLPPRPQSNHSSSSGAAPPPSSRDLHRSHPSDDDLRRIRTSISDKGIAVSESYISSNTPEIRKRLSSAVQLGSKRPTTPDDVESFDRSRRPRRADEGVNRHALDASANYKRARSRAGLHDSWEPFGSSSAGPPPPHHHGLRGPSPPPPAMRMVDREWEREREDRLPRERVRESGGHRERASGQRSLRQASRSPLRLNPRNVNETAGGREYDPRGNARGDRW